MNKFNRYVNYWQAASRSALLVLSILPVFGDCAKTVPTAASNWSAACVAMHLLKPREASGPLHLSEKSNNSHGPQWGEKHISNL
jgi:hypothetical protein